MANLEIEGQIIFNVSLLSEQDKPSFPSGFSYQKAELTLQGAYKLS